MPKNIKCTQCKYLQEFGIVSPTEGSSTSFTCKADGSIELDDNNIKQIRDCRFFRSRTETAYGEVKKDLIQKLKSFLKELK